jgi:hypothetical protein
MAIRKTSEGISQWNNKLPFPKDRYTIRCIEESFGLSKSSDNPMISRTWEVLTPELVTIGDKQVNVAGAKIQQYVVCKVKDPETGGWDAKKSDVKFGQLRDDLTALGYEGEEIDDENPPMIGMGKVVDAILYGKVNQSFREPTPEEKAQGKRVGQPIKDGAGNDVKTYQINIDTILGLATAEANRPY